GAVEIPKFELGDVVQWGMAEHFGPGFGFNLEGQRPQAHWLAGRGKGLSYGLIARAGKMDTRNGLAWSDGIFASPDIGVGQKVSYERFFAVVPGGVSAVSDLALILRGDSFGTVRGQVTELDSRGVVRGARVNILDRNGKPLTQAETNDKGEYRMWLAPSEYNVTVDGPGLTPSPSMTVIVTAGETKPLDIAVPPPGEVAFEILDESGRRIPGKLTFEGVGMTPSPRLGPKYAASGADNVIFCHTGQGKSPMPPGTYRLVVSRGIEYSVHRQELIVSAGPAARVQARLVREVDTTGYVSADLHQHCRNSPDSATSLEDRVISNLCEGVELIVASDHDYLTDFAPV
ncbi:MAG: carboxypeptidase regulatory-like domain-containing protein, partial [Planctomycetes bacterium]|nr:carboxypeptidase regulatory-like domain-containing protein [Planctomycetota bacterium]